MPGGRSAGRWRAPRSRPGADQRSATARPGSGTDPMARAFSAGSARPSLAATGGPILDPRPQHHRPPAGSTPAAISTQNRAFFSRISFFDHTSRHLTNKEVLQRPIEPAIGIRDCRRERAEGVCGSNRPGGTDGRPGPGNCSSVHPSAAEDAVSDRCARRHLADDSRVGR